MLERSQSLLEYYNSTAFVQNWYTTDHGSHTPLQDDETNVVNQTSRRQDVCWLRRVQD